MIQVIVRSIQFILFVVFAVAVLSVSAFAQSSNNNDPLVPGRDRTDDQPKTVKEYLAKQRTEKDKKEHEELLKRAEEAALLSEQLDTAFAKNNQLSPVDQAKLESLEKLVSKIRKNLGADDDEAEETPKNAAPQPRPPSTVEEAFSELKDMTGKLVDEVKKTTRFTVSAMAIQTSNSVLKLVRFLRLRK